MGALLGRLDWGEIERRSQNGPTIEDRLLFSGWDGGSAVPTTAACQDVFNLCDSEATTWLENGAQEAYPLEIYLEVDLSLKWMKKNVTYLLRMWLIFTPMCGSVSFKWLWHGPTVTQREIFFISLYLYIFSFTYWTYCVWVCLWV